MDNELTRAHFGDYYLAMNPGYRYVYYQQEQIVPALEAVERGEEKRLMIFMPPGHAKSDIATRNFIPWFMGKNPQKNAMVASYAATLAANDFGANIKKQMESQLFADLFPRSVPSRDSRAKDNIKNISGGEFYAVGFDGGMAGRRVDLFLLDDLLKNDEEADSEARLSFLFNTYGSVVKSRLRPGGAIVFCQHRWRIRDVAGRILEAEGTKENGGDWTVLKIKAEHNGAYLWEEHFGKKHYDDAKKYEDSWHSMWQQEPAASSSLWFREEWLNFYDIPVPTGKYNTYMFVDPALAKGKRSDRTSIFVIAAGQDEKLFWVDGVLDRLDPGERAATIMRLLRRWNPESLYYEEYGLQSDTYWLSRELDKTSWSGAYPIAVGRSGKEHSLSKAQRIKGLVPYFSEGKFFFPRQMNRKNHEGKIVDLVDWFIKKEYTLYKGEASVPHDDMLDCLSRTVGAAFDYAVNPEDREIIPRYRRHGGWESVY